MTTKDSFVFGGNILHTMGATMQSKCIEMEADADIPDQNKYTSLFLKTVIINK